VDSPVTRALEQIAEIHEQLGRTAVFRGWRPIPVASSGLVGLVAAAWQAADTRPLEPWQFTVYWLAVGVVAMLIGCAEIVWHYFARADEVERGRSRHVVGQLLPSLMAGALVTGAFIRLSPSLVALLPGLWALFFGVGVFATGPYAVRGSHWIALYYWTAGLALLWNAQGLDVLSPWAVGGTFGAGQFLAAGVLYVNLERPAAMMQRTHDDDTQA
jgi:hypothetical protein